MQCHPFHIAYFAANLLVEGRGPIAEMPAMVVVYAQQAVEADRRPVAPHGVRHRMIGAANDARLIETRRLDEFPPGRPCEPRFTMPIVVAFAHRLRVERSGGGEAAPSISF